MTTSGTSDSEWYEWQRVVQLVTASGTTSDSEWQRMAANDSGTVNENEWEQVKNRVILSFKMKQMGHEWKWFLNNFTPFYAIYNYYTFSNIDNL